MTQKEYNKIVEIIENNMVVSHDNPNAPRLVLTQQGLHNAKQQIKELVKGDN